MIYREALLSDIPQIFTVRFSVKENQLSNPDLVTVEDCVEYLTARGKGWVCEIDNIIVGFAIADLVDCNVWALFVMPEYTGKGIGKHLHHIMLDWYFSQTDQPLWLGTAPHTKAALFYEKQGWGLVGSRTNGELKFEMTAAHWKEKVNKRI